MVKFYGDVDSAIRGAITEQLEKGEGSLKIMETCICDFRNTSHHIIRDAYMDAICNYAYKKYHNDFLGMMWYATGMLKGWDDAITVCELEYRLSLVGLKLDIELVRARLSSIARRDDVA